ncbi:hypothetical protein KFL_004590110 [Klebsormidium nitens]|uniref:Uncharacterized protein n=1 Tax=Klebsormidium nitens TaxID=105231 RepID=A0A1Y1IH28_KLENI|nr:hypothetical protein KFL_004590110 [Klebsormidium nitens]|eukprot:GAQ88789.1 hypothetical protein KFL_004590110 [Klebsormidium nitens]
MMVPTGAMAAPAPLELQGERGPSQQELSGLDQDLVDAEVKMPENAPARKAFLKRRHGRLASQRVARVPLESRLFEPGRGLKRARRPHQLARSSEKDGPSLPAVGQTSAQGGHTAWKESKGEHGGTTSAWTGSPSNVQVDSISDAQRVALPRAGTHKLQLALQAAAAGRRAPAAYTEAARTAARLEAGTLALQLVTWKQGGAASPEGRHGGASQAGRQRPSWDDRFWKAPSSVSSLMVPGVVSGQWLRKTAVDASVGASGRRGSKRPGPETGRAPVANPASSAAFSKMALAAAIASRDFARRARSPEGGHDHGVISAPRGQPFLAHSPPSRTIPVSSSGADGAPQGLPSGAAGVKGMMSGAPRGGWKQGDPIGSQERSAQRRPDALAPGLNEPSKVLGQPRSERWGKVNVQTTLPARERSTAHPGEASLVGSMASESVRSPSEQGLPAGGKEGAPLSALLRRAGGLGAVLAAAAYEVDQEARHFVEAIRRQRGSAAGRGAGGRPEHSGSTAQVELRALQAEMARETALAEGLARLTDSLTQRGLRSGIAHLQQHLARAGTGAEGGDVRSRLRQVAEAQLDTAKEGEGAARVDSSKASTRMLHSERTEAVQAGPTGARPGGAVEGQGRGSSGEEARGGCPADGSPRGRPAHGQGQVAGRAEGQAGPSGEAGQGPSEGERGPEPAVATSVGPPSARQPAALFLRQLRAVEALEDSLRVKWLTDPLLHPGQDGSTPLEAQCGASWPTKTCQIGRGDAAEPRPELGSLTRATSDGFCRSTLPTMQRGTAAPSEAALVGHGGLTDGQAAQQPGAPAVGGAPRGAVVGAGLGALLEVSAEQLLAWCSAAVDDLVDSEFRTPPATPASTRDARHSPLVRSCAA